MRTLLIFAAIAFMTMTLSAQELKDHRWNDRVLMLYTDDLDNPEYERQIRELKRDWQGVEDRRLVVYTILQEGYARGLPPEFWVRNASPRKLPATGFYLELVGLDGGTKLREEQYQPIADLWSLIDGMPIRRSELSKKGNPKRF